MHKQPLFLGRILAYGAACIIALIPLHAFLTVFASSFLGHYTALRLWKEVLLAVMVIGVVFLVITQVKLRRQLLTAQLLWLIGGYLLFLVTTALFSLWAGTANPKAALYGVLLDGRFLVFFLITWSLSLYNDLIVKRWRELILIPAALVVGFATLQYSVLPPDVLRHFGYGPATIPPAGTVDQQATYTRIQSTLRGANPFGAYLIVVISAFATLLLRGKRWFWSAALALSGGALFFTFSRSAWLGVLAALCSLIVLQLRSTRSRRLAAGLIAVAVVVGALTAYGLRNNNHFQNVFLHTSDTSRSAKSSNDGHLLAVKTGLADLLLQPWGRGPGTAGPASVYNDAPSRIAENYYIQVGQEIGVVGLTMFIVINIWVGRALWQRRQSQLALVLFVSLIGISVVNLLSHAWTDDTLAYLWWGMAGAALAGLDEPTA